MGGVGSKKRVLVCDVEGGRGFRSRSFILYSYVCISRFPHPRSILNANANGPRYINIDVY